MWENFNTCHDEVDVALSVLAIHNDAGRHFQSVSHLSLIPTHELVSC